MNCALVPDQSPCRLSLLPSRYDVEYSETTFCCGGLLRPCTTPGCTECGTHFLPLFSSTMGATRPWCVPSHARCTGDKEKVTCEACRRRLGLEPLPYCISSSKSTMRSDQCYDYAQWVALWDSMPSVPEHDGLATSSLRASQTENAVCILDGHIATNCVTTEAIAHQDGTVEVFRAGQLIARGRWGKKGLGRVEGVVSGIEPCPSELLADLERRIQIDGNGPIDGDIHTCGKCGGEAVEVYGSNNGVMGPMYICRGDCHQS